MQQRRLRLGDILDDYCPRERRVTNHVVVAMIGEDVKQTRCATCDADHEYKQARVPTPRRKKAGAALAAEGVLRPRPAQSDGHDEHDDHGGHEGHEDHEDQEIDEGHEEHEGYASQDALERDSIEQDLDADVATAPLQTSATEAPAAEAAGEETEPPAAAEEDGPVHRRLIRATLPRPEGQVPERKAPEFTIRQPGGRGGREFDGNKAGANRGGRGGRWSRPQGGGTPGQPSRFGGGGGGPRQGSGPRHGSGQGPRHQGNRPGGQGGPPRGPGRGPGGGGGRKRGR